MVIGSPFTVAKKMKAMQKSTSKRKDKYTMAHKAGKINELQNERQQAKHKSPCSLVPGLKN